MFGLSVRWSLTGLKPEVADELRRYVADTSLPGFSGMAGLRMKTWRMRAEEWFEGTYVFGSEQARDEFASTFRGKADTVPVSVMLGAPPELIEPFEVLAVAEGADGFAAGVGPGH